MKFRTYGRVSDDSVVLRAFTRTQVADEVIEYEEAGFHHDPRQCDRVDVRNACPRAATRNR